MCQSVRGVFILVCGDVSRGSISLVLYSRKLLELVVYVLDLIAVAVDNSFQLAVVFVVLVACKLIISYAYTVRVAEDIIGKNIIRAVGGYTGKSVCGVVLILYAGIRCVRRVTRGGRVVYRGINSK